MSKKATDFTRWLRVRAVIIAVTFGLVFAALCARAVWLQIIEQEKLSSIAAGEISLLIEVPPRRGIIFDRNHEELAVSLDTVSVYAHPKAVKNPARAAAALAKPIGENRRALQRKLSDKRSFVWLKRRIDPEKAEQIIQLKIKGVGLIHEPRRFYPNGRLACHVLGFAGMDANGLEGLERGQDKLLRGESQRLTTYRDALGRRIQMTGEVETSLTEGSHIILTLDKHIQYAAEKALAKTVQKYKAKAGQVIVMSPQTGEILAMASLPVFNPNVFGRSKRNTYRNRAVTDMYEPGSTFKVFVAAAALASHKVSLDQKFDCEHGSWRLGGRTIHDTHEYDELTLAEIVKYSSNIGAAKVAQAMGPQVLYNALTIFGFGSRTGVDLPGEARGILRAPESWRPVEMANIAFGQGVSVTPLQLVQAVAAVANGGVMMRPHVVKAVLDSQSRVVRENEPEAVRRVMSAREARILVEMLQAVTAEGGTGTLARIGSLPVAGKTGTAQKVEPGKGYSHEEYMSSFIGFVPADDPKIVTLVLIDTPYRQHYGGVVAGPAFAEISRVALRELGVHEFQSPAVRMAAREAEKTATSAPVKADFSQAKASADQGLTPDLKGLTLRQIMRLSADGGIKIKTQGWGRVVWQQPLPGGKLPGSGLSVRLSPAHGGA